MEESEVFTWSITYRIDPAKETPLGEGVFTILATNEKEATESARRRIWNVHRENIGRSQIRIVSVTRTDLKDDQLGL